jgi:LPXTG-motif cell wall-anchored protein
MGNADSSLPNGNANIIIVIVCLLVLSISIIKNKNSDNKPLDLDNINLVGNEEELPKLILKNDTLVPKNPFIDSFNTGGINNQILLAIGFSLAIVSSVYFIYKVLKIYKVFDKKK